MGLIPRETQSNINAALKCLYSIDKSLGRIADALERHNELTEIEGIKFYAEEGEFTDEES